MAILPNVTFDVYRGFNPANPYAPPNTPAALAGQTGRLRPHVRNGRFGYTPAGAQPIHWTNVLDLAVGTDVRSAYNSQQNAFNEANGDTLLVYDYPVPGTCTAFCVVMVQLRQGYLRAYLDRAQPSYGMTCPDPTQVSGLTPCCPHALPLTLHATYHDEGACPEVNGLSVPITWDPHRQWWFGHYVNPLNSAQFIDTTLFCSGAGGVLGWRLGYNFGGYTVPLLNALPGSSCTPLVLIFPTTPLGNNTWCPPFGGFNTYVSATVTP